MQHNSKKIFHSTQVFFFLEEGKSRRKRHFRITETAFEKIITGFEKIITPKEKILSAFRFR